MATLLWIVGTGLHISVTALIGSVTLLLKPSTLHLLFPLLALAAGSLLRGAVFHMLPDSEVGDG